MKLIRARRTASQLPTYVVLTLLAVFALYPIVMLVFNSLKSNRDIGVNPLGPPAVESMQWQNYPKAWVSGNYAVTMRNSAVIASGSVAGVLVVAGMAAYSLARLKPPGGDYVLVYLIIGTAVPTLLFLFPLFFLWKQLGLIDNLLGVIIINTARFSTFSTFLLRSYMVSIPKDFEDAALIDGASRFHILRHIIVPITKPGFLTVGLIVTLWSWNEFLIAVTFIHRPDLKPVATSLYAFASRYGRDWALTNAASVLMLLPALVIFLIFQRQFIEGMTKGGVKG
jgi:raffinose/stachyose/melibiose transport system permease protein